MELRLLRYKEFIDNQYADCLLKNKEYSLGKLDENLKNKITNKQFDRILFVGMGCSAIVSDIIKGFFAQQNIPIFIEVINDYEIDYLINKKELESGKTLVIFTSHSGHSQEPIEAYSRIKKLTDNIIFLTSGGKLEEIARKENVSIIYWKITSADREYPLFHAPQFFSIILDIFCSLGLLESNYEKELIQASEYIKKGFAEKIQKAEKYANELVDKEIILLASPKWYLSLLKLVKMHINEIAMAPAHRNYLHEFGHSESAMLSDPKQKQALLIFREKSEDSYLEDKIKQTIEIFTEPVKQNKNISVLTVEMDGNNFIGQLFSALNFIQYLTYYLGVLYNYKPRELISRSTGNPWYSIDIIKKEKNNNVVTIIKKTPNPKNNKIKIS
ncbi:hypothetical protein KJ742_07535 [Patescibacteria group bacterium]|nr:hypothetical protein [Patescibacteria group bacterium]MBU1683763.1 hypothetical protein [Patescibacteria group bacterium]MBU1935127.1 hypothetical protein [Patescibacteria group bacterium]